MLKALKVLSMTMVAAMAVAPRVQASDALKANVPFDFVVAGQAMPSGEYQFVRSEDPRVVQVYSRERGRVVITAYTAAPAAMPEAGLVFHKIGEQRFLKSISIGRTTIALPTTRAERLAVAAQGAGRTVASTVE